MSLHYPSCSYLSSTVPDGKNLSSLLFNITFTLDHSNPKVSVYKYLISFTSATVNMPLILNKVMVPPVLDTLKGHDFDIRKQIP